MNTDITYCGSATCKKKLDCKRHIGNYSVAELNKWEAEENHKWLLATDCINKNYELFISKK